MPLVLNGTGTIGGLSAGGLPSSSVTAANLASGAARTNFGAGAILQVVQISKSDTFAGTSVLDNGGYFIDVTGLSGQITPASASNRILVIADFYIGTTTTSGGYQHSYRLKRTIGASTTFPILGNAEGGRPRATGRISLYGLGQHSMHRHGGTHIDSPNTTNAITYQVQLGGYAGSPIVYVNRAENLQILANDYDTVPVSTLTLIEIAS